jgi:hypothetical protein
MCVTVAGPNDLDCSSSRKSHLKNTDTHLKNLHTQVHELDCVASSGHSGRRGRRSCSLFFTSVGWIRRKGETVLVHVYICFLLSFWHVYICVLQSFSVYSLELGSWQGG